MSNQDSGGGTPLGAPDDDRSGATVEEAVAKAEQGSQVAGVHRAPAPGDTGEARREEIRTVEGATDGVVEGTPGAVPAPPEPGPGPTDIGAAGAQRVEGARISDRVAAGQPVPNGPLEEDTDPS